jgi:hypothetical protein
MRRREFIAGLGGAVVLPHKAAAQSQKLLQAGGADIMRATARVTFWGALAMVATAGIGKFFGAVV